MNERTKEQDEDFLKTLLIFAIVVKADLNQIQTLKRFLSEQDLNVIFQKTSANKLFIRETNHDY